MKLLLILLVAGLATACNKTPQEPTVKGRWYSQSQIDTGKVLFETNCATCHGTQAQGLSKNWRKRLPDKSFPPPPLNGTAHAWHHPLSVLLKTIEDGGAPLGGTMPAFKGKLSNDERLAVIAYFQTFWPQKTYDEWQKLGGTSR